jgi:hypothetical protein
MAPEIAVEVPAGEVASDWSVAELRQIRENLSGWLPGEVKSAVHDLKMALPDWRRCAPYSDLGTTFSNLATTLRRRFDGPTFVGVSRLLVVDLALELPESVAKRNIPDSVLALYPAAMGRLVAYLRDVEDPEYGYPQDYFVKDLRFASGLTVPCGAQVVDLRSNVGRRGSVRMLLQRPSMRHLPSFVRSGQLIPWFRIHTESRYLEDFNEPGWDACYLRIASLLRAHPNVLGMTGTSWFYDPQLETVSPRLGYLRMRPMAHGAILIRGSSSAFDIRSATATSETRRRLYEQGRYLPTSYSLMWPRDALLDWARRHQA